MKLSKIIGSFGALVLALAACTTQPSGEKFGFRTGDYSVYENVALDSAGRTSGATTRSTRTVLRTGVTVGGQSDAVEIIDSNFASTPTTVSRVYYRVANDEVFYYLDTNGVAAQVGALAMGGAVPTLRGFTARWVKEAELKDAAGTQDFPSVDFSISTEQPPLGTITVNVKIVGRNQGKTALMSNSSTTYQTHKQAQTVTVSTSLLGAVLNIPVTSDYYYGIPAEGAPRTIIRREAKSTSVSIPLLGAITVPGQRSSLVSFRAGQ